MSRGAWALALASALWSTPPAAADDWSMFGQNYGNTASTSTPGQSMSAKEVGKLKAKWVFTTGGDVSARAAVVNNVVYFPDWGGNLWALGAQNGNPIWGHQLSDYGLPANTHSRTSPAVVNGTVFVGTQEGAYLLAIDAASGNLLWKTQLESADPYAIVTASPVVYNGTVYEGVASLAEGATFSGVNLATSTARGSVVAINAVTGAIRWKTYTAPAGYIGAGVWGSNAVVDAGRNTLFVGTGDNYAHPQSTAPSAKAGMNFGQCIAGDTEANCLSPDDHVDSIIALDLTTGAVKWARRMLTWNQFYAHDGSDDWNVDCIFGLSQCPTNPGPDYDFSSAPNEITYQTPSGPKTIIGAGQKSGIYYAFDPDTGADLWHTQVGPGSSLGGIEWGSASDGQRIYVAIVNVYGIPYGGGNAGSWSALDPATGAILWQKADPNGAIDLGPLAVADGVLYAPSMGLGAAAATSPTMFALDAATGATLWSYVAGSSVNAGAVISGEVVYWGSGYAHLGLGAGNNKFYAFAK